MEQQEFYTATQLAEEHSIRREWIYEQLKKDIYKDFVKREHKTVLITKCGYSLILKDIDKFKKKKEKNSKTTLKELEKNSFCNCKELKKELEMQIKNIENLHANKKFLEEQINFLEMQNSTLIETINITQNLLNQQQQLALLNTKNTTSFKQKLLSIFSKK